MTLSSIKGITFFAKIVEIKTVHHCTKNEVLQDTAYLVTFTGEILNGKLNFLCSAWFFGAFCFAKIYLLSCIL